MAETPKSEFKPYGRTETLLIEMYGSDWARLMDFGAWNGSWHSGTLSRLVKRGLVEKKERGSNRSFQYRLTEEGKKLALALRDERYVR
jgi:DNA-binding HxlR family transcriptional regulator